MIYIHKVIFLAFVFRARVQQQSLLKSDAWTSSTKDLKTLMAI